MPDPSEWARHFRSRADECQRLAEIIGSEELRKQFRKTASHYLALAEFEEMSKGQSHSDSDRAENPPPLAAK
jgi:hypothetical protein